MIDVSTNAQTPAYGLWLAVSVFLPGVTLAPSITMQNRIQTIYNILSLALKRRPLAPHQSPCLILVMQAGLR